VSHDQRNRYRLSADQLRWVCDPRTFSFQTTADLAGTEAVIVGQDRAVRALDLGLTLRQPGYNMFIAGPVGTGRTTYARKEVSAAAATRPVPPDWCYV